MDVSQRCRNILSKITCYLLISICVMLSQTSWAKEVFYTYAENIQRAQKLGFYNEAIRLLESSENQDSPDELNRLGWLLMSQQSSSEENKLRGFTLIRRAAAMKYPPAMANLAAIYVDETLPGKLPNFQTSPAQWKRLMEESSALGYGFASKSLASAYWSGKYTLRRDTREACIYAKLAEDQGLSSMPLPLSLNIKQSSPERDLNLLLSICYESGAGGEMNLKLALAYAYLSESENEIFNIISEKDRKVIGRLVQYEKIANEMAPEERQTAYEFVRKWFEQRNKTIPVLLRNDLPDDPHILAARLANASLFVKLSKLDSIRSQLEKNSEMLTLKIMSNRENINKRPSNLRLNPDYKKTLHEIHEANRQLVKELSVEEKFRDAIDAYFEKELTANELKELVAFYEGQNGELLMRGMSKILEISHEATLKMADIYASNPKNVKQVLQEMESKYEVQKSALEVERVSVIKEATMGMNRFSEPLRMIFGGLGIIGVTNNVDLSGHMDNWIEFFVLDGGDKLFGFRNSYVFLISKEQKAIYEWMGRGRLSEPWKKYYQTMSELVHKPFSKVTH